VVRTIAEMLAGQAAVAQVNTQENPVLSARFAVRGIPIIILLKQGRVIDQLPGAQTVETVLKWFSKHQ
jgi:thioredoxin 2